MVTATSAPVKPTLRSEAARGGASHGHGARRSFAARLTRSPPVNVASALQPALCRVWAAEQLASRVPHAVQRDVQCVVAELANNAVLHGGGLLGVQLYVGAGGDVTVMTDDRRVGVEPVARPFADGADGSETGRGLRLVAALTVEFASRTCTSIDGHFKRVWAVVPATPRVPHEKA
ncbi:MAG: Histidine kinaselike ATPase domain [Frankiaceae bacterium]|nr:Histidine kinaselike ATPase domain [Frankiaceae bacterium]